MSFLFVSFSGATALRPVPNPALWSVNRSLEYATTVVTFKTEPLLPPLDTFRNAFFQTPLKATEFALFFRFRKIFLSSFSVVSWREDV